MSHNTSLVQETETRTAEFPSMACRCHALLMHLPEEEETIMCRRVHRSTLATGVSSPPSSLAG
jgi:hypothetical protein